MISLAWNYLFLCRYNINSKQQVKGKFSQSHGKNWHLPFAVCCKLDSKFLYCVRINFIYSLIDSFIHCRLYSIFFLQVQTLQKQVHANALFQGSHSHENSFNFSWSSVNVIEYNKFFHQRISWSFLWITYIFGKLKDEFNNY